MEFDYFVNLDSDCLFANYGFEKIFDRKFDFNIDLDKKYPEWHHSVAFFDNIKHYKNILQDLNLKRKDNEIVGCLGTIQIYSKRAVKFISDNINKIENSLGYKKLLRKKVFLYESLIVNILKDAGFCSTSIRHESNNPVILNTIRWRPYWTEDEIKGIPNSKLGILYHPVKREKEDTFRRLILEKTKLVR